MITQLRVYGLSVDCTLLPQFGCGFHRIDPMISFAKQGGCGCVIRVDKPGSGGAEERGPGQREESFDPDTAFFQ